MNHQQPRRGGRLLPILPRPPEFAHALCDAEVGESNGSHPSAASTRRKRATISIACGNCRRRKAKCNGSKPICGRCKSRGEECIYELGRGKALTTVLKKRQDALLQENEQYRQLLHLLWTKPEVEAQEIFRRLRASSEPRAIVDALRQAEMLLVSPSLESERNRRLDRLDRQALDDSIIKVPARPWTVVVGDGLMSELITNLFTWNGTYFFPFLDQEAFIEDMQSGDVEDARWCTPLLVNAICAVESNFLRRAKQFEVISGRNLPGRFFEEAKGLLEREQGQLFRE